MSILHEKLPCAKGFFTLKKEFRQKAENLSSPIRTIASPKMIRGLSITKKEREEEKASGLNSAHKEIRITNHKPNRKASMISNSFASNSSPIEFRNKALDIKKLTNKTDPV
jgi:hypothetical protein